LCICCRLTFIVLVIILFQAHLSPSSHSKSLPSPYNTSQTPPSGTSITASVPSLQKFFQSLFSTIPYTSRLSFLSFFSLFSSFLPSSTSSLPTPVAVVDPSFAPVALLQLAHSRKRIHAYTLHRHFFDTVPPTTKGIINHEVSIGNNLQALLFRRVFRARDGSPVRKPAVEQQPAPKHAALQQESVPKISAATAAARA